MDEGYFYDTNYHLNDVGVTICTARLAADLLRARGDLSPAPIPDLSPPARPAYFLDLAECDTSGFFLFEETDSGCTLVGITEAGRACPSLKIPRGWEGLAVTVVAEGAFDGCGALTELIFPADTRVALCEDGAFAGAPQLAVVRMLCDPDQVPVGESLLRDAAPTLYFYIPRRLYGAYAAHYFWSPYIRHMIVYDSQ